MSTHCRRSILALSGAVHRMLRRVHRVLRRVHRMLHRVLHRMLHRMLRALGVYARPAGLVPSKAPP